MHLIGAFLIAQLVKNLPAMQETPVWFLGQKILWRRDRLPTPVFLGFPCGSAGKEATCNAGDLGLIPGLGRSLGEGKGYPLQYSGLENSMDCIAHGVTKSRTRLSDFHSLTSKRIKFSKGGKMHFLSFHRNIHYWFYNQTITVTKVREVSNIHFGKHRKLVKKKKKK